VPGSVSGAASNAPTPAGAQSILQWLGQNLLVVVTFLLAIAAFIVAWVLRRAAARRDDDLEDNDDEPYSGGPTIDPKALSRRLDEIDLDLGEPRLDEREPRLPRA
jgi:pilus assembly protein FimV